MTESTCKSTFAVHFCYILYFQWDNYVQMSDTHTTGLFNHSVGLLVIDVPPQQSNCKAAGIRKKSNCWWRRSSCLTSPSLCLLAEWATGAPPHRPLLAGSARLCCGRGCAGSGGSWWMPTDTGRFASHGGPPAERGSTVPLSPVGRKVETKGLLPHK